MSVLGEMNSEEVGKVLGKPAGTIRYQISEARKRISQEVGI
jgi:DNA-directed RNA polymerase specialized sigma24 family protein